MTKQKILPGVKKNILLKNYTTFKIGGRARYFFTAENKKEIMSAVKWAKENDSPFFILGRGSNVLVSDKGFKGLVIKIVNCKLKIVNCKLIAEGGVPLNKLVSFALDNHLTGMEWAVGIPGSVGGAICGNAGAFKKSMKDIIKKVEVFDLEKQKIKILKNKDCGFSYRESIFKKNKNLIILSAEIKLEKGEVENMKDKKNKMKEFLNYRKECQPLNLPSAGSVFKNFTPHRNEISGAGPSAHKELEKFKKTGIMPAGYLIEKCGLKGKKIGNVKISEKHANFIVNLGNGKAEDVLKLINLVKTKVKNKFGTELEEEIQYLGF